LTYCRDAAKGMNVKAHHLLGFMGVITGICLCLAAVWLGHWLHEITKDIEGWTFHPTRATAFTGVTAVFISGTVIGFMSLIYVVGGPQAFSKDSSM
jgi:hypothetical protein